MNLTLHIPDEMPTEVCAELLHPAAPDPVRRWAASPPSWLVVTSRPAPDDPRLASLDAGEAAAITLALSLPADLVLMDDRAGVAAARAKKLNVMLSSPAGQLVSWSQTRRCGSRATGVFCRQEGSPWASFRFNYPTI